MLRSFFRNHLLSFQPEPTSSNWPRPAALLRGIWRLGCRCDPRTCRTHRLRPLGGIACAHLVECRRGQAGLRDRGVFRRTARMSSRRCAIESSPTSPGSLRLRRSPEQRVPRGELRGRDSPPALGRARRGDSGPTKRATGGTSHGAIPTASPARLRHVGERSSRRTAHRRLIERSDVVIRPRGRGRAIRRTFAARFRRLQESDRRRRRWCRWTRSLCARR
jgi:hypothetical protein